MFDFERLLFAIGRLTLRRISNQDEQSQGVFHGRNRTFTGTR